MDWGVLNFIYKISVSNIQHNQWNKRRSPKLSHRIVNKGSDHMM